MEVESCCLCQLKLPTHPILDGTLRFCCHGCQAVYSILSAKGEADNYQTNPLFHQAIRFGLISNPVLVEQLRLKTNTLQDLEYQKIHFEIGEMWCPSCGEVIRLVLMQEKGIKNCFVDYATDLASVEFAPRLISKTDIFSLIKSLGYQPQNFEDSKTKPLSRSLYLRFIVAAFCALNVMMFAYPLYATYFDDDQQRMGSLFAWVSFFATLPVVTYASWPIFRRFFSGFSVGLFGMEALVVIGVSAGFGLSTYELIQGGTRVYFDSICVIITFILLGKIIENRAKFSAKESLFRLNRSLPKRGRKLYQDGTHTYLPIKELKIGDRLQVLMGETIVLDGVVTQGEGSCNESLMTGEPRLIPKGIGSKVVGGSLLQHGNIVIDITAVQNESTLHRIVEMIEQDIGRKTTYVRAADALVRWFVPLVLLVAIFSGIYTWISTDSSQSQSPLEAAILRAVTVLLISCPCALGIAAPLAESYLINALTALGVIVRNRGALQFLGRENWFVFDKTGTITEGRFKVISGMDQLSQNEFSLLYGLVAKSNHPIAAAIAGTSFGIETKFTKIEEVAGKGLRGYLNDEIYLLGSAKFLEEHGYKIAAEDHNEQTSISTTIYFSGNSSPKKLVLGDCLREDVAKTLKALSPAKTFLLSGDGKSCVKFVAHQCGFSEFLAQATPLDKREKVEQLKVNHQIICMVGDGINDAPALTSAHVGISVLSASDISIQVSDILLTTDRLDVIPKLRSLAIKGRRIIHQNLFWAFFYNVIGIGLASAGLLSPIFAAFAMVTSSLIVLFNAQRLRRIEKENINNTTS